MNIDDRFKGIAVFIGAASAGSFTLAAERLGLTPSAVGKSIARLESRLGARLFHRTTRSIGLTEEGKAFLETCMRACAMLDAGQAALDVRQRMPAGRLRLDLPTVFGRQCIMPALFALASRFPQLELDVTFNNRPVDLADGGIDLVVRIGRLEDSTHLSARLLGYHRQVVCASAAYLQTHGAPASPDDLSSHACITQGRGDAVTPWVFSGADGLVNQKRVSSRHQFSHVDSIADAVRAGHGLAQLPTWLIADGLAAGVLTTVLDDYLPENLPIHAVWLKARRMTPKIRVVVDALVRHFQ